VQSSEKKNVDPNDNFITLLLLLLLLAVNSSEKLLIKEIPLSEIAK
jgi:hypothetical protein